MRLVVAISGASGAIYGIRALQTLNRAGVETHLVLTDAALQTIRLETDYKKTDVERLATEVHRVDDVTSKIASGSFRTDGMLVIPCSMKTLAGIASGYSDNLLLRAADVTLKERRRLVLVVRETPLSLIHIENMATVTRAGAVVLPAMPAFYHKPKTVQALVDQVIGKALDLFGVEHRLYRRWGQTARPGKGTTSGSSDEREP
jgi:polyprenyl P-hydroxybenzoate/phenylacrylic acid decarboxylase-like protein